MSKSLYFLGATVVSPQALSRIKTYTEKVRGLREKIDEKHLTVLPPFFATYEEASDINLGCMQASILSTHPINTTLFAMKGLDIMEFGGMKFLHFPIQAFTTQKESWEAYVLRLRKRLTEFNVDFRHKIPDEYRVHVTIHEGEKLDSDKSIRALIKESQRETILHFNAYYLTLYAKYPHGWDTLTHDPARP